MRLFVAVSLNDAVIAAAGDCAQQLKRRLPSGVHAKWVAPENMHLTVRFIGHVADDRTPTLLDRLRPPLPISPFDVALGACGVFPPTGPTRVIWIGIDKGLESLRAMHEEFNRRIEPLGFVSEKRPFSVHLTLARVNEVPRGVSRAIRETVRSVSCGPSSSPVSVATVYQSLLSPKGPTYRPLFDVSCAG